VYLQVLGCRCCHVGDAARIHALRSHVIQVAAQFEDEGRQAVVGREAGQPGGIGVRRAGRLVRSDAVQGKQGVGKPGVQKRGTELARLASKHLLSRQAMGGWAAILVIPAAPGSTHPMAPSAVRPNTAPTAVTTCRWGR